MRKILVIGIGVAIIIAAIGIAGVTLTDLTNFEGMSDNDQDNSMQMSDNIELTVTAPDEEEKSTSIGTGDE